MKLSEDVCNQCYEEINYNYSDYCRCDWCHAQVHRHTGHPTCVSFVTFPNREFKFLVLNERICNDCYAGDL